MAVIMLASCSSHDVNIVDDVSIVLDSLDEVLSESHIYEKIKEQRILSCKSDLMSVQSLENQYNIYDRLFGEYDKFDQDSALLYLGLKEKVAFQTSENSLRYDSILDYVEFCIICGLYHEAFTKLDELDYDIIQSQGLLPRYFHIYNTIYAGLAFEAVDPVAKEKYRAQHAKYRSLLSSNLGSSDIAKIFVDAESLIDEGAYLDAVDLLKGRLDSGNLTIHDRAIIYYLLATASLKSGDRIEAVRYYAESAIADIQTPVRDYKSLYELAGLLYDIGDVERAYRYISRSIEDAQKSNTRVNIDNINSLLPIIFDSYQRHIKAKQRVLNILLLCISLLMAVLVFFTVLLVKDKKSLAFSASQIRSSNEELRLANERLQRYIARLKESNQIKEAYISRYIDLCSEYIRRLEEYRSTLRQLAKSGGYAEIQKELRSTSVTDAELEEFYARFDATFLDLFPDFIVQLNKLLHEDKQCQLGKDGLLTTELRICALIRLGVTDSVKIADFLRRSVSTVYNYRVKMRNAALSDREDFEKGIMRIGQQIQ